ncbi:MAG: UPF0149 family protein [Desulfopila sp.]|jgi:yecA family protein|nr:UPF0149 family protein [Desulfopila sp.]
MKSLVSKKEEKALKELLSLAPVPEVTFSYYELRGFLYGIAITPDGIEPGEWLPLIFDEEMPDYGSAEKARQLTGALFTVLNKHIAAFYNSTLFMPFDMENLGEKNAQSLLEWASGFEEALSLRPECWEECRALSDDEQDRLLNSLIIVEGLVFPEEAAAMFEHMPTEELLGIGINPAAGEAEKIAQMQFFMMQALGLAVETIQRHALALEKKKKEDIRSSTSPFRLRSSSIGKSTPCPCGSGKTIRECCGSPGETKTATGSGKKGEIIKVDFSRRGNKKPQSKKKSESTSGSRYQLEITLSSTEPLVWRRIVIPSSFSLAELHQVIQRSMGWQQYHMHQFTTGKKVYGPQTADDYLGQPVLDESRFYLNELEKELLQGMVYTYDFGDNWTHVILLEKVITEDSGPLIPVVLDGARACPPEDIGGVPMYQELLRYIAGTVDDATWTVFTEMGLQDFNPDLFDAQAVNSHFKRIYGRK